MTVDHKFGVDFVLLTDEDLVKLGYGDSLRSEDGGIVLQVDNRRGDRSLSLVRPTPSPKEAP